jgi:hypothetical protein
MIGWLALALAAFLTCGLWLEKQFHDAPELPWHD